MSVESLLSRLDRVRQTSPGKWIARCPTRDDKRPSLSIRELDDGRILLHDFGGDDVASILSAVGLSFADLYPAQAGDFAKPVARPFNASDVLDLVAFESTTVALIAADMLHKRLVSDVDFARLLSAAQCLGDAAFTENDPRERAREVELMKSDPLKTAVSRIAALRSRSAYRLEKQRLLGELREARQRGENPVEFLAAQERQALTDEALGRRHS